MNRIIIIAILLLALAGCKKNAIKTHPDIFGTWHWLNWCSENNYIDKDFNVDFNGKGGYQIYYGTTGESEEYSGKVRTDDNDLYIGGEFVFTIVEVVDTVGVISNPYPPSFCNNDQIQVSGILRVLNKDGVAETYWKN